MSEQEIYERLNEVFRNVFDDDEIEVEAGTTADDIEDWDSLEHINLISAVNSACGCELPQIPPLELSAVS